MKAFKITLLLFLILLILVFGAFVALRMSGLELQLSAPHLPLLAPAPPPLPSGDTLPKLALQPATAEEKLLDQAYAMFAQLSAEFLEGRTSSFGAVNYRGTPLAAGR